MTAAGPTVIPATTLASRARAPGRVARTASRATERMAPRVWVTVRAIPANRPDANVAARWAGESSSERNTHTAAASDAAVVNQWWLFSRGARTAQAVARSIGRGRRPDARVPAA